MKLRASLLVSTRLGLLLICILGFTLAITIPASARPAVAQAASNSVIINNVRVDIWPEYDQPTVLVIYNITLSSQTSLPVDMTIRIPAAAGKPYAVAWESPDKALYELKYQSTTSGPWIELKFNAPSPDIRIEYYDPDLKKTASQRNFTFRWPGDYTVENLSLKIQQPVNAADLTFVPAAGSGQLENDGLTYYTIQAGKVAAGTTFDLAISYTKPDDALTSPKQFQPAQPNQPVNSSTSGRVAFDQMLPWIIGGAGLLLIAAGFLWYWRSGHSTAALPERRQRHARSASTVPAAASPAASTGPAEASFCHQCGKKSSPGDVFCRNCGTKLR